MDSETHSFAAEATAQIEVLRSAVLLLTTHLMQGLPESEREAVLGAFASAAAEIPPGAPLPTPRATQFFEAVAAAIPGHADKFVADVRHALG